MKKQFLNFLVLFLTTIPFFPAFADNGESVFDRVMRTQTIRCGYFSWYPALVKDPNTGELSSIFYDYMNEIGKSLSLKIDWAEEIGLGDFPAALRSGRIDAMCSGIWITGDRGRSVDFVSPIYYMPLYLYTRVGDTRFDEDFMILNDPKYKIGTLDGGATSTIQRQLLPKSSVVELPQTTSPAELFINLELKKTDAVIYVPTTFHDYDDHNPDKIRQAGKRPIKVFANAVAVKQGEMEFLHMLNLATNELVAGGDMERIIRKHEKYKGTILRVAQPYEIDQ